MVLNLQKCFQIATRVLNQIGLLSFKSSPKHKTSFTKNLFKIISSFDIKRLIIYFKIVVRLNFRSGRALEVVQILMTNPVEFMVRETSLKTVLLFRATLVKEFSLFNFFACLAFFVIFTLKFLFRLPLSQS